MEMPRIGVMAWLCLLKNEDSGFDSGRYGVGGKDQLRKRSRS